MDLRSYRESRGLTQQQAAEELGLRSKAHISQVETRLGYPSIRLALQIEEWSDGAVRAVELLAPPDVHLLLKANLSPTEAA